jgi:hypothetical protein
MFEMINLRIGYGEILLINMIGKDFCHFPCMRQHANKLTKESLHKGREIGSYNADLALRQQNADTNNVASAFLQFRL